MKSPAIIRRLHAIRPTSWEGMPRSTGIVAATRLSDLRVKSNLASRIKLFLSVQSLSKKIFRFAFRANHLFISGHPVPREGRWPSSRTLGRDAVDARGAEDESARDADGEVVWS